MKNLKYIILLFSFGTLGAQCDFIKNNNNKWSCTKNGEVIIPPIYDTILPFDKSKNICMACVKTQKPNTNKFIKMNNTVLMCKYLNQKNEHLIIKIKNDTCNYFNYNKSAFENYTKHPEYISVSAKDKKYIVDKAFKQITFTGFDEIQPTAIKNYFVVQKKTIGSSYLEGVIDMNEKIVVPIEYASVTSNPYDSLFIACTGQLQIMGNDYVFDYNGSKIHSANKHIENATKNFLIHKVHNPTDHYIVYNIQSKKEKAIYADEITYLGNDSLKIKIKSKEYNCDMFKLEEYKFLNHD